MNWPFELPKLQCLRCKHQWIPRKAATPRRCPRCKSPYWDVPRTIKGRQKVRSKVNGS